MGEGGLVEKRRDLSLKWANALHRFSISLGRNHPGRKWHREVLLKRKEIPDVSGGTKLYQRADLSCQGRFLFCFASIFAGKKSLKINLIN